MTARWLALALLLAASPLLSACNSDSSEGCASVAENICDRISQCDALEPAFSSADECQASFAGYFEVAGSDDDACEDTWSAVKDLDCSGFLDYFDI